MDEILPLSLLDQFFAIRTQKYFLAQVNGDEKRDGDYSPSSGDDDVFATDEDICKLNSR